MMSMCKVVGCERKIRSKSLCSMHYGRLLRSGAPGEAGSRRSGVIPQYVWDAVYMFDSGAGWGEVLTRTNKKPTTLAAELRRAGRNDLSSRILTGISLGMN